MLSNSITDRNEEGFYLVLVAFIALVLLGFCALVLGVGYLSTGKHFLQNSANFAALAALESYVTEPDLDYNDRINAARDRANLILERNRLIGTSGPLGDVDHPGAGGAGGEIFFGAWHVENPDGGGQEGGPCEGAYPCFVAAEGDIDAQTINAVRINAGNQEGNPLIAPFVNVFGVENLFISAQATAAIARRCGAFLIDVTRSNSASTHIAPFGSTPYHPENNPKPIGGPDVRSNPLTVGFFATPLSQLKNSGSMVDCENGPIVGISQLAWCNMGMEVLIDGEVHWTTERTDYFGPTQRFQSDFDVNDWPSDATGQIMVDRFFQSYEEYFGPQPISTFFLSFHAALRLLQAQGSFGDLIRITGFAGDPGGRSSFPIYEPNEGLEDHFSDDIELGIELTNMNRRGLKTLDGSTETVPPSFIDFAWVPLQHVASSADGQTNIGGVLREAANLVGEHCPANSNKFIIMASDFKNNCSQDSENSPIVCTDAFSSVDGNGNYVPGAYDHFVQARKDITGEQGMIYDESVIEILQERRIAFTAMLDGAYIQPHFINRVRPDPECENEAHPPHECYLTLEEASAYGYGGYGSSTPEEEFFSSASYMPDSNGDPVVATDYNIVFPNAGKTPGWVFGQALPLAARIAQDTGGLICPLMDVGEPTMYENAAGASPGEPEDGPYYLKSQYRTPNPPDNIQFIYPEYLTKAEQAAICAQKTVGLQPYILVTEKP